MQFVLTIGQTKHTYMHAYMEASFWFSVVIA